MRILHVSPYDLSRPGGVQTHTLALAAAQRRLGHDAVVYGASSAALRDDRDWLRPLGRPRRVRMGATAADLTLSPTALRRLRTALSDGGWNIVHIQEPLLPALATAALLWPPAGARTVVTLHSAESAAARLYDHAAPALRPLLSRADAIICASRIALDTARPSLPRPAHLIPPCIDDAPLRNLAAPASDSCDPLILFIGRDEPRKGLPVLVSAFSQIDPPARLRIVGPVQASTRRLARQLRIDQRIDEIGPVPTDQLPQHLAAAARDGVAVFPALGGEALGLVLVEAMTAGVPVIASDIPGYRIPARNGRSALLVAPDDPSALVNAIERLLSDDALRARQIAAARASARRFRAAQVARQHLDLYQRLIDARVP